MTVVVTCRDDAAAGLESFSFHADIPRFYLARLGPGLVRVIIDRLTERPAGAPRVIADPEGGWTALRDRMVDEYRTRGQVLPQQLKVAIKGLATLRRLTPADYARAGRASGLEARFVTVALQTAAKTSELTDAEVLQLLVPLVDRIRQHPDKARPRSTADLAATAGVAEQGAKLALERLQADEILRRRELAEGVELGVATGSRLLGVADPAYRARARPMATSPNRAGERVCGRYLAQKMGHLATGKHAGAAPFSPSARTVSLFGATTIRADQCRPRPAKHRATFFSLDILLAGQ